MESANWVDFLGAAMENFVGTVMECANWVDFLGAGLVPVGMALWFISKRSGGGSVLKLPLWKTDWKDVGIFLLLGIISMRVGLGFLLPCIVFFALRVYSPSRYESALTTRPLPARKIVQISFYSFLFFWPIIFLFEIASVNLVPLLWPGAEPQDNVRLLGEGEWQVQTRIAFFALIVAPFTEELFFRGILYRTLKRVIDVGPAMFVTSFAFALAHFNLLAFAPLFALSFCLILSYERTGHLGVPILYHAIFNLVGVISILYGSY